MRVPLLTCLLFAAVRSSAQVCAATPEGAAMAIIGAMGPARIVKGNSGYRVQDVQTDAVMQRVWVRVTRCGDVSAPLILVPLHANLAGAASPPQPPALNVSTVLQNTTASQPPANIAAPMAVHAGDAVKAVFISANVQIELDATANGQAAIGSPVEITLARRGDEPQHRMRGVLRATGRVEVQP